MHLSSHRRRDRWHPTTMHWQDEHIKCPWLVTSLGHCPCLSFRPGQFLAQLPVHVQSLAVEAAGDASPMA